MAIYSKQQIFHSVRWKKKMYFPVQEYEMVFH